ncbi:MAG TPA: hypothetical protein VGD71_06580 [Kribbella sp.]|jgi:hypothetical protein
MTRLSTPFMSGQDIYDNFQQGSGADGISSSAAIVNQLARRHQERFERLHQLKARMGLAWQGAAAGAAQRGLGPLVTEQRVDRGELTWRQIREGIADPAATRLYRENLNAFLDEMARVKQEAEEADAAAERVAAERRSQRDDEEQPTTVLKKRTGRRRDGS